MPGGWLEAQTPEGKTYYYNQITKETTWTRPSQLAAGGAPSLWKEVIDPASGRPYWYNEETRETTWVKPDGFGDAAASQPPQQQVQPYGVGAGRSYGHAGQDRDRDFGGERVAVAVNTANEPEYTNIDDAREGFAKALKRAQVQPDWSWEQALKATIKDREYRALKVPKERVLAFQEYCGKAIEAEKNRERDRVAKLQTDFTIMLRSHPEIRYYTRWKTALGIISDESVFRAAKDDSERKNIFDEYIKKLKEAQKNKEADDREAALQKLRRLIDKMNIDADTRWVDLHDRLQRMDEFQSTINDHVHARDILDVFEDQRKQAERQVEFRRRNAKAAQARIERKNRDAFKALLHELKAAGNINASTQWGDLVDLIQNDQRFLAMLGQPGSTAEELFDDLIEVEHTHLREQRATVREIQEELDYEVYPSTTFDEFYRAVKRHHRAHDMSRESLSMVFDYIFKKVQQRADENAHYLRRRIGRLDNPRVTANSTWEQVRPRLVGTKELEYLGEGLAKKAFEKYLERESKEGQGSADDGRERVRRDHRERTRGGVEREREREREYRNGHSSSRRHRTRTRSPEPDAYAADRRRAMADREIRFSTSGSTGLSPRHRRERDDRSLLDHYEPRSSLGPHDRRERAMEPDVVLDYGDGGASQPVAASPLRRRRDSRDRSPEGRRDAKRPRRDHNTRELSTPPRHDRRSRTPAQQTGKAITPAPPAKEDPGLRSGSEEGEIEED